MYAPKNSKLFGKGSKKVLETLQKTSKWLPNWCPDTLGKQSYPRTRFGLPKRPLFSARHRHGGGHRHPKMVPKSFQNNPKINTPWRRPSGITFCSIWKLRREVLRRNLIYFSKVFHMPISSLAHLQFLKDVPSVFHVFDNPKGLILEPRGPHLDNFFRCCSNLQLRGHTTP